MNDTKRLREERNNLLSALQVLSNYVEKDGARMDALQGIVSDSLAEFQQLKSKLHEQQREAREAEFRAAWARMEAAGYRYGKDAIEQVRLGWRLARGEL